MPLIKKILKSGPREAIIKWTGSGTDTLTLASLLVTGQTVSGTPVAIITAVKSALDTSGICTITRNAQEALHVNGNYSIDTDDHYVLDENGSFDIAVSLATLGTLIIRLQKIQGYTGI